MPHALLSARDHAAAISDIDMRRAARADDLADLIIIVRSRTGRGTHLCNAHVTVASANRNPQQQIGERKVRQQLPLGGEPMQMLAGFDRQVGVCGDDVAKS